MSDSQTTPVVKPPWSGARTISALLSVDEVSALIGVAVPTLDTWRCRGFGPPWYKLGGKIVRYRLDELEAWIDSKRRELDGPARAQRQLALPVLRSRQDLDRRHRIGRHRTQSERRTAGGGGSTETHSRRPARPVEDTTEAVP